MGRGCPRGLSQGLMYKTHDKRNNKKLVKYQIDEIKNIMKEVFTG